jgi:hypothetical protein
MITIPAATDIPLQMAVYELTPSEAQMEQFWKLYNSIDHVCTEDAALLDIILEQTQSYFVGDKTLDETADLIQRREPVRQRESVTPSASPPTCPTSAPV